MLRKTIFYALAVVVLMGSMGVAALADDHGTYMSEPAEYSVSAHPEQGMEQADAGEIRGPVETGAVPDWSERPPYGNCCGNSGDPTFWPGGL